MHHLIRFFLLGSLALNTHATMKNSIYDDETREIESQLVALKTDQQSDVLRRIRKGDSFSTDLQPSAPKDASPSENFPIKRLRHYGAIASFCQTQLSLGSYEEKAEALFTLAYLFATPGINFPIEGKYDVPTARLWLLENLSFFSSQPDVELEKKALCYLWSAHLKMDLSSHGFWGKDSLPWEEAGRDLQSAEKLAGPKARAEIQSQIQALQKHWRGGSAKESGKPELSSPAGDGEPSPLSASEAQSTPLRSNLPPKQARALFPEDLEIPHPKRRKTPLSAFSAGTASPASNHQKEVQAEDAPFEEIMQEYNATFREDRRVLIETLNTYLKKDQTREMKKIFYLLVKEYIANYGEDELPSQTVRTFTKYIESIVGWKEGTITSKKTSDLYTKIRKEALKKRLLLRSS